MSEVGWYYDGGGHQAGPVGTPELVELIRSGRVAPGTRVWRAGLTGWVAWETVPDLASLLTSPGSPPPLGTPPASSPPPPTGWVAAPVPPGPTGFPPNSYAADVLSGAGAGALYPKAPLGGRFLAALIDGLATVPAVALWVFAVAAFTSDSTPLGIGLAVAAVAASIWALLYSFTKDGRPGGQSIGKKMMGLMVVHLSSNQPCSRGQSALRYLVLLLLNLVPYIGWLVEPIVTLSAAGGRRLGDSAAGTQVIRTADHARRA